MSTAVLAALASATLLVASPVAAQEAAGREPGTLIGRVLQEGHPASGVRVLAVAAGFSKTTGGNGRFRMESLSPGVHRLIVVHPDFGTDSARVAVARGTTTGLTLRYGPERRLKPTVHLGGLPAAEAGEATGQARGRSRIVGDLIDRKTGDPIPSASVRLPSVARQTRTTKEGRFVFDSLGIGTYTVRVNHVRYGTQRTEVQVPDRRTVEAEIRLAPEAIEMEPIQVNVDVRSPRLASADYYQRREWGEKTGYGHFLEGETLEKRGNRISEALGTIPRLSIGSFGGQMSAGSNIPYFPGHRGFNGQCLPAVYLDGQKVVGSGPATEVATQFGPRGLNGLVNLSEVAAVEIYPSASATAGEFQGADSRCGVIVIWTGRGEEGR